MRPIRDNSFCLPGSPTGNHSALGLENIFEDMAKLFGKLPSRHRENYGIGLPGSANPYCDSTHQSAGSKCVIQSFTRPELAQLAKAPAAKATGIIKGM